MPNQEKLFPKVIGDVPYPIELMTGAAELELLSLFFFLTGAAVVTKEFMMNAVMNVE